MRPVPRTLGRYVLIRRLASGGMGEVFLAEVQGAANFTKRVAIKRILPHLARNEDFVRKFIDEAHVMVQLHHGNIVPVIELVDQDGELFLVMEYLPGRDLKNVLHRVRQRERAFPADLAMWVVAEVCAGLDYAHRKVGTDGTPLHIVHRDVSPSNIVLGAGGEVKLLDFGIARARGGLHQSISGMLQGKFVYMSPEQAEGRRVDPRSDVFSAGLVLYELLCGTRPLEGESETETLRLVRDCRIPAPSTHRADLPPAVDELLLRAVARDADERFASAADMRRELLHHLMSTGSRADAGALSRFLAEVFPEGVVPPDDPEKPVSLDDALAMQLGALGGSGRSGSAGSGSGETRTLTGPDGAVRPVSGTTPTAAPPTPRSQPGVPVSPVGDSAPMPSLPPGTGPVPALPPRRRSRVVAGVAVLVAVSATAVAAWALWPRMAVIQPLVTPADVPDVRFTVDDVEWFGRIRLPSGEHHTVCAKASGYVPACRRARFGAGTHDLALRLEPLPKLVATVEPTAARLTLDGAPLEAGRPALLDHADANHEYRVCAELEGASECKSFRRAPGHDERVALKIEPRPAPDAGVAAAPPPDAGVAAEDEPPRPPHVRPAVARRTVALKVVPADAQLFVGAKQLPAPRVELVGEGDTAEVRITADGHREKRVRIGWRDPATIEVALEKAPTGRLSARALPANARLLLGDRPLPNPTWDMDVPEGEYMLTAVWDAGGRPPQRKKIRIVAGELRTEVLDFGVSPQEAP